MALVDQSSSYVFPLLGDNYINEGTIISLVDCYCFFVSHFIVEVAVGHGDIEKSMYHVVKSWDVEELLGIWGNTRVY